MLAVDTCLEVQMLGGGTSGTSGQRDGLSGFDRVAAVHKVFRVVAVYRFQSEAMPHDNDIAISTVGLGHPYHSVEGTPYGVFGMGLDVYAAVAPLAPPVVGDDFTSGEGEGVLRVRNAVQRQLNLPALRKQSRGGNADVAGFHSGKSRLLLLCCGSKEEE